MSATTGGEVVGVKTTSDLVVVPGDEYSLIDANKRQAHICW